MPIWIVLAVAILFVISIFYFIRFYRRHVQGENAPEQKKLMSRFSINKAWLSLAPSQVKITKSTGFMFSPPRADPNANSWSAYIITMHSTQATAAP